MIWKEDEIPDHCYQSDNVATFLSFSKTRKHVFTKQRIQVAFWLSRCIFVHIHCKLMVMVVMTVPFFPIIVKYIHAISPWRYPKDLASS